MADAVSTTIMRRLSELVRVIKAFAQWFGFQPSDGSAQRKLSIFRLKATSDEGVVAVVMALLPLRIRHPEPNGSRRPTSSFPKHGPSAESFFS